MSSISVLQKAGHLFLFWLFCSFIATTVMACEFDVVIKPSCASELEKNLMPKVPFRVQRNSNFLHLQTQAGALAFPVFKENTEDDTLPYLVAYLEEVQLAVVWVYEYRGRSVYLVNIHTGVQTQINGFPLLSPDKNRLLVYSEARSDKENANLLLIYQIRRNKLYVELIMSGDDNRIQPWNPLNVRWISPDKVEFTRLHYHNEQEEQQHHSLQLKQGKWQLR
jgi:hypothetical protein